MDSFVSSLCFLCVMTVTSAFPPMHFFSESGLSLCEANKACRVNVRTLGAQEVDYISPQICACPGGTTCPAAWDAVPDRSVTMQLRSYGRQLRLRIKYCRTVVPEVECQPGQVALHVKGVTFIPTEVVDYSCTCPNNNPLRLWNVWKQQHQRHQEFTCA